MKKKLFLITLIFLVIPYLFSINVFAEPWKLLIKTVEGQGDHVTNVVIGMDADTNNIGAWPVAPSMPNFAAEVKIIDQYIDPNYEEFGEIIRPERSSEDWILDVTVGVPTLLIHPSLVDPNSCLMDPNTEDPNSCYPDPNSWSVADADLPDFFPELSWDTNDIADIDPNTPVQLRLGGAGGEVLVDNMRTTSTYMTDANDALASGGYYDDANNTARMRYAVVYGTGENIITQEIPLEAGWNLISFQINHCYYERTPPDEGGQSIFLPQGIIMKNLGSGYDSLENWLSDDANSPLRDAADPSKAGNWQRLQASDSQGFRFMDKDLNIFANNMSYISAGYGYWIKMNEPGFLILEGPAISSDISIELRNGWNLIGYIPNDICYAEIPQQNVCPYTSGLYSSGEVSYCSVNQFTVVNSVFESINGKYRRIQSSDRCQGFLFYDTHLSQYANSLKYIGPKYGYWIKIEEQGGAVLTFPENCSGIQ